MCEIPTTLFCLETNLSSSIITFYFYKNMCVHDTDDKNMGCCSADDNTNQFDSDQITLSTSFPV